MWSYYYLCCPKRFPIPLQELFEQIPMNTRKIIVQRIKHNDIEMLLDTLFKQSSDRIEIIFGILSKAPLVSQEILFSKEVRLLKSFIKVDTIHLQDVLEHTEEYLSKLKPNAV